MDMFAMMLLLPSADQKAVNLSKWASHACESYSYENAGK